MRAIQEGIQKNSQKGKQDPSYLNFENQIAELNREIQLQLGLNRPDTELAAGDRYGQIIENAFLHPKDAPLSTFGLDVDTASYANIRKFLLESRQAPPPDAVRLEELVNYFRYDYAGPTDGRPFAVHVEVAGCPWAPKHRLLRVALQGKSVPRKERPAANLVFLIDVSGSMQDEDKLPLVQQGLRLLVGQIEERDRVAIVVYAGSEGLALPATGGHRREEITAAIDRLRAGGSTNGGAGIQLAYKVAQENFVRGGINRVILCTDGDFNVGVTSPGDLERLAEEKRATGVFLSVFGFGRGNLNDQGMQGIANKGNGAYAYIDGLKEAQRVFVEQVEGTLVTIAKDVKMQVEFNPAQVGAYRLLGYENRLLTAQDFNDDRKDAGEIGARHTVTALYEIVPPGEQAAAAKVDPLKYQKEEPREKAKPAAPAAGDGELCTVKLRYKLPDEEASQRLERAVKDDGQPFARASRDFQFAAAAAGFGLLLRRSEYAGQATFAGLLEIATAAQGEDPQGYRREFADLIRAARKITGRE